MSETRYTVTIREIEVITHDVKRYIVDKPDGYAFEPGQATEVAINKEGLTDEARPFTFTSLPDDDHLEFVIKSYPSHNGVTDKLDDLKVGDELIIGDSWGAIQYKGPGWFIAGGAGVTPFIAILKKLAKDGNLKGNHLLFSNKTSKDVIMEGQFREWLGDHFISTLTDEKKDGHLNKMINEELLKELIEDTSVNFYVCGPDQMVKDISSQLENLGASADEIVFEK
ncbi:MAG: flavodoxin reductase [Cyclobacteriaceae bacterium]|nr:flavodoxin reductase [Cyclobacteriaceae bacterium SS2]